MSTLRTQDMINRPIKIQFINGHIPVENTNGSDAYVLDFLRYLEQAGCEVEYVSLDPLPGGKFPWYVIPSTILETFANMEVYNNLRIGGVVLRFNSLSDWVKEPLRVIYRRLFNNDLKNIYRAARAAGKRLQKRHEQQLPTTNSYVENWQEILATSEDAAFAKTLFDRFKPDVVVVNYVFLANILDAFSPDETGLKVILTHDVFYKRNASFKEIGILLEAGTWNWEIEAMQLRKAQLLLAIQEEDAKLLKEMAPQSEVICTPKAAVLHSHTVKQVPGRCLFVGSGAHHNYYSLQWFLENVWPTVIQLIPDCSLHVCGSVCNLIKGTFPNVHLLGIVEDLKPEYGAAEVCLIPLLAGSGLKIKLVEAMSYGRACVSTSVGVQGLRDISGKTTLVADTSEDFAASVHMLLSNPDKRQWMEEQAHKYVTEKLSPEAAYQPFLDYIHQYLQQVSSQPKIVGFEETVDLGKVTSSSK